MDTSWEYLRGQDQAVPGSDVERFFNRYRQIVYVFDEEIIFRARPAQPNVICFLEGIVTDMEVDT